MNNGHLTQEEGKRIEHYEDEIELMDYLLVIWKWKYVIITGTLAFVFAAATISVITLKQQPTMYRTSIVLKLGILKIDEKGDKVFIDTRENIKALIENDLKLKVLEQINNLNDSKLSNALDFKVDIPNGSDNINISFESASKDEGITKLNYLIKALLSEFNYKISHIQKEIDEQIEQKKYKFDELLFKEKIIKSKIVKYQQDISDIEANIKFLQDNKDISQNKEYMIAKLSLENDYRNTFQRYFVLNEKAKINLFELQRKISLVANELKDLEKTKNNLKIDPFLHTNLYEIQKNTIKFTKDIKILDKEKRNIQIIQVIQPPMITELPKSNKISHNLILSSVVGFFSMLFLSLFLEYFNNYKKRVHNK